jgi:ribosomal-protein-alanine N-acetyltransferase
MIAGDPDILTLRPAALTDAGLLAALHAPCFPDDPWPAAAMGSLLESLGVFGLIAEEEGWARGFILCRLAADEGEVLSLAVPPPARRQGIGRRLLAGALAWARAWRVTTLFLEVAEDNPAARALYRAAGFTVVGHRPGYYRRGSVTVAAEVMSRSLLAEG